MTTRSGKVTVTTENIFPIIRKWLYTDHDIFVRELVSNSADAISKMKRIIDLGEAGSLTEGAFRIDVTFDAKNSCLSFSDNGIGMTAEEIDKYINQIAFSGAMDFVEKYKEQSSDDSGIIGHFGLGFYSAFMVADKVSIETKSFVDGENAVKWESEDGMEYTISPSSRTDRGTTISLYLSEEAASIFDALKTKEILKKYCSYIPYPLFFRDLEQQELSTEREKEKAAEASEKNEEYSESVYEPERINPKEPLWTKAPKDCTTSDYISFYHDVFPDVRDPLFWIHLNLDYPFKLQGILYFPKTDNIYQTLEGRIKIYNQQVFVADNIEEIIPDFLFLLRGCLDCTDLPLNVSRSALQQDEYVKKLSTHIIRKVSDKLSEIMKHERSAYESYWSDIGVFVKYGMMKEDKFYEKAKDVLLFKTVDGSYKTYGELLTDKDSIRYTRDPDRQATYVDISREKGFEVVILSDEIDPNFISFMEYKNPQNRFMRVDAELSGEAGPAVEQEALRDLFRSATGDDKLDVSLISLGAEQLPVFIRETEEARRMQEMKKQFEKMRKPGEDDPYQDLDSMFPEKSDLVVNSDHPLIIRLQTLKETAEEKEELHKLCLHLYDMARLNHGSLSADGLKRFLKTQSEWLLKLSGDIK
ncbi:MAG: molecular chaperone HtpG [Clostridiaceae bacterium]|nr:molecular chaperone HtpG [Oscillospiraceae bacterium]NLO62665.1 molecular chaperone HtpG [Clostridiaceae bacterium]